jgi:hypothetical protein
LIPSSTQLWIHGGHEISEVSRVKCFYLIPNNKLYGRKHHVWKLKQLEIFIFSKMIETDNIFRLDTI